MRWRRRALIAVLALGTIGGYGLEFARWRASHRHGGCGSHGRHRRWSEPATTGAEGAVPEDPAKGR